MFTLSGLALLLVGVSQVMIGFVLPFYLQDVLHITPTFIGLLFVSAPIFTVTLSPLVGWAVDKMGPRLPATVEAPVREPHRAQVGRPDRTAGSVGVAQLGPPHR